MSKKTHKRPKATKSALPVARNGKGKVTTKKGKSEVVAILVNEKKILIPRSKYDSLLETAEISADADAMKAIKKSIRQASKGKVVPWDELKRQLGL